MNTESNTEEVKSPLGKLKMVDDAAKPKFQAVTPKDEKQEEQQIEDKSQTQQEDEKVVQQKQKEQLQKQDEKGNEERNEAQINDDVVLNYLKNEKGLDINNFESLTKTEQKELDIPDDVKSYLDYKKETNRSYSDYLELQKDWKSESEEVVLSRYLKEKNPYFDQEDINDELSDFKYDEEVDDEGEIRKKKRNKKKLLSEAISYLESQKEKYKAPVEGSSTDATIPNEYKEAKAKLDEFTKSQQEQQTLVEQKTQEFVNKTKELITDDFEGFKYPIGDNEFIFKADKDASSIRESQSDINNFIAKFTDKEGNLVDLEGYHKALNAAMNVDKLAVHFYEQGKADAVKSDAKDSKNINFSGRKAPDMSKAKKGLKAVESKTRTFGFKQR